MPIAMEPYKKYKFRIEIAGFARAGFQECGELSTNINNIQYREGDDQNAVRNFRGVAEFDELTLSRGITADRSFWEWAKEVYDPGQGFGAATYKRDLALVQLGEDNSVKNIYQILQAYPRQCKVGPWDAMDKTGVTIESLTLVFEGIQG
jgi:phage tail-like protein